MTGIALVDLDGGHSSLRVGGLVTRALLRRCGFTATVGLVVLELNLAGSALLLLGILDSGGNR
jgi:hypothetical protein